MVNLSSLSAIQVNPDSAAYNVAKAAQDHLTKTLARKYTKLGVRINSVNPGFVICFSLTAEHLLQWHHCRQDAQNSCCCKRNNFLTLFIRAGFIPCLLGLIDETSMSLVCQQSSTAFWCPCRLLHFKAAGEQTEGVVRVLH